MSEPGSAHELIAPLLARAADEVRAAAQRFVATAMRRPRAAHLGDATEGEGQDTDALHDLRVALRRLRTAVRAARAVYGRAMLEPIEQDLRRFARASGRLRDEEVLVETLGDLELRPRLRRAIDDWLAGRASAARSRRRRLAALIRAATTPAAPDATSARTGSHAALAETARGLVRGLDALRAPLEPRHPSRSAREVAEAALDRALHDVRAHAGARDVGGMHALRIRWKRARYTAELFASQLGQRHELVKVAGTRMQKRLGELHDVDQAIAVVARARRLSQREKGLVGSILEKERKSRDHRALTDLSNALAEIASK